MKKTLFIITIVCSLFVQKANSQGFFEREKAVEKKLEPQATFVLSADSGARCKSSSECEGFCVYPLDTSDEIALTHAKYLMAIKEPTEGRCSMNALEVVTKCIVIVEKGVIAGRVCPK